MISPLKEKCALVTGGSRGIGAAIVRRLARDGAHVALTYVGRSDEANEAAKAAHNLGVSALAIQADSAQPEAVAAAVERTVAELGQIDILVNNAGVISIAPIDAFSLMTLTTPLRSTYERSLWRPKPRSNTCKRAGASSTSAVVMPSGYRLPAAPSTP